jgi:hypothetical protein
MDATIRKSGRLDFEARALEPLHHGAGTSGNTQILRTQRIYSPTVGRIVRLPYISGNSFKHLIRAGSTKFALEAMGIEDGTLTKPVVHLLFSGGALGKKGSTVKIDKARELEKLFPALSMCGYSAANNMPPSKLKVDHLHLVCQENLFRMPAHLQKTPEAEKRMAEFRSEEFGTRHEPTRMDHTAKRMLPAEILEADQKSMSLAADQVDRGTAREKQSGTAQMLYEFETITTGGLWWGGLWFDELTELELAALKSGLAYAARGKAGDGGIVFMLGAKSSVGFGRVSAQFTGALREVSAPQYKTSDLPVPGDKKDGTELKSYVVHLKENKDDILALLQAVA